MDCKIINFIYGLGKFSKEVEYEKLAINLGKEKASGDYQLVSTEELKQWMDDGKDMLIVDTMPLEDSFKKNHIPGADQFLFPIPEMKNWTEHETGGRSLEEFEQLLGDNKDKVIVFYCGFVKCTRSHNGAMWARKLGYNNVYRHPGGIFAWRGAKYDFSVGSGK